MDATLMVFVERRFFKWATGISDNRTHMLIQPHHQANGRRIVEDDGFQCLRGVQPCRPTDNDGMNYNLPASLKQST